MRDCMDQKSMARTRAIALHMGLDISMTPQRTAVRTPATTAGIAGAIAKSGLQAIPEIIIPTIPPNQALAVTPRSMNWKEGRKPPRRSIHPLKKKSPYVK